MLDGFAINVIRSLQMENNRYSRLLSELRCSDFDAEGLSSAEEYTKQRIIQWCGVITKLYGNEDTEK
jgi:hypothetical protein